jgi:hypothetical protein
MNSRNKENDTDDGNNVETKTRKKSNYICVCLFCFDSEIIIFKYVVIKIFDCIYICFDENNVNRTCILKSIRKNIFKILKSTIFKKIDTLCSRKNRTIKNLVIVESPAKKTIEKFLVVIFKWSQVTGILPTCLLKR